MVRAEHPLIRRGSWTPWLRKHGAGLRLAGCFSFVFLVTGFTLTLMRIQGGNLIWVTNGLLLAYLLLAPRWRWPAYLVAGYAAQVAAIVLVAHGWDGSLICPAIGTAEVAIAALLLRRRSTQLPDFANREFLLRFGLYALVVGPAVSGGLFALHAAFGRHDASVQTFINWVAVDALGIAVATPASVAILQCGFRAPVNWRRYWFYPVLLGIVTVIAFAVPGVPTISFIYPLLLLILLALGLAPAAAGILYVAAVGSWFTLHGQDPLVHANFASRIAASARLQLYIAAGMFMIYSVSAVLERLKATERRLAKIAALHALVTENSRDAILVADFDGNRSYVSAAVERLIGWPPAEFTRYKTLDLLHPEDRAKVAAAVNGLRSDAEGATIECRIRKNSADYLWVEASLRGVCDPETGVPTGVLNIVRDISERKRMEESRAFQFSLIRAIFDVSLDGILVSDNTDRMFGCNKRLSETLEIRVPDILPGPVAEGSMGTHRDLLARCADLVNDPEELERRVEEICNDPDINDKTQIELKDGRTLERFTSSLRDKSGEYLGRVWFFRDISERKIAQQKLHDAYKAVEALAATDSLTGIANRRRFDQVLNTEWRRGLRDRSSLSLLMIDVDLFKSYNDEYGHPQGDTCLKQIAEVIQNAIARPGDMVARFGGEEFTVILPRTDRAGALNLAMEICEAMRGRKIRHEDNPAGAVTLSVGCATMLPAFGEHAVGLIELADEALYEAKHRGRNQVCASEARAEGATEFPPPGVTDSNIGHFA